MFNRNYRAIQEKRQARLDSGFVSMHFPDVESIVISMMYSQKGASSVLRTLFFSPESHAFFKVTCLNSDCADGGFDMSRIISSMVRNHSVTSKGKLDCDDDGAGTDHSNISYEVAIQYTGA